MKIVNQKDNYAFCFRHWANKPYAAFNSLKKNIKIGVLSVTYSLITLTAQDVFARPDTSVLNKTIVLGDAMVRGARPQPYLGTTHVVTVITKDDIETMPARSVADLLENIGGIDVRKRGGEGVQADISIKGGSFDQALILLNGINITDPQTGHHNLNIPVNLADIERIEILQGAGLRTSGTGAFSGAINIVTGESKNKRLNVGITGGQYGYFTPSGSINYTTTHIGILASASHSQSDGYIANTDFTINNFFLQTQYTNKDIGKLEWQGAYQSKAFGSNSFYSPAYPNQFERTHTFFSSAKWDKPFNDKLRLETAIYWRRHYDLYELIRDSARGRNYHRTDAYGLQSKVIYQWGLGKTIAGAGLRNEEIVSTGLGTLLSHPFDVHFNRNSTHPQYIYGAERTILDYFIDHSLMVDKLSLSAGVLGSWSSAYGNNWCVGVDAGYQILSSLKLFAGVNQSLRLPTYTELFYKAEGYAADRNLIPEKALSYEGGIKFVKPTLSSYLSIYYRQGKNLIDWVKLHDADPWQSRNLTEVNAIGTEIMISYSPRYSWIHKLQLNVATQTLGKHANNYLSKYVLDYMKYKLVTGIDHKIFSPSLTASWRISYQDRVGTYTDFKTKQETPYPPFLLVDVRITYSRPHFSLFIEADNLTDIHYMDIANIEQAGRWIKAGVNIIIGKI